MKNLLKIFATSGAVFLALFTTQSSFALTVIGTTEVSLDGRQEAIRTQETNLGNLVADSLFWEAIENNFTPDVVLSNSGGIRGDLIPAGELTDVDIQTILPFNNNIVGFTNISALDFKNLVENGLEDVNIADDGRFPQISGFTFTYNPGNPEGSRIDTLSLADNTVIVKNGFVVADAPGISVVTNQFIATGGDDYPFPDSFIDLGFSEQEALTNYITTGLNGTVTAVQYPEGGNGRIAAVPEPVTMLGSALAIAIGAISRKHNNTKI